MNRNAIIDFMFDELENKEAIKLKEDTTYIENLRSENQICDRLSKYLKKRVHSKKTKENIMKLVDEYADSCRDTTYTANRIYYYQGFIDGIVFSNK